MCNVEDLSSSCRTFRHSSIMTWFFRTTGKKTASAGDASRGVHGLVRQARSWRLPGDGGPYSPPVSRLRRTRVFAILLPAGEERVGGNDLGRHLPQGLPRLPATLLQAVHGLGLRDLQPLHQDPLRLLDSFAELEGLLQLLAVVA